MFAPPRQLSSEGFFSDLLMLLSPTENQPDREYEGTESPSSSVAAVTLLRRARARFDCAHLLTEE
jgi:hypothetical protein